MLEILLIIIIMISLWFQLHLHTAYVFMQTWEHFERGKLVGLVDASLNGDFDAEEACRFLKTGLLCTQENPKVRPSMSTVVKMLMGKVVDIEDAKIRKPVLISDFMELKVRAPRKSLQEEDSKNTTSSFNATSSNTSGSENHSNLSSENSGTAITNTGRSSGFIVKEEQRRRKRVE